MRRRVLIMTWLTVLWIVLWRDLSAANLLAGVAVAFVASGGATDVRSRVWRHRVRPLALVRFFVFFSWKLVEANIVLAREVVTPTNVINTGIIAVPLPGYSDLVVAVVANAISLTPGTLTLEVRRDPVPVFYVHVLHLHDLDKARADVVRMAAMAGAAIETIDDGRAPTGPDDAAPGDRVIG